MSLSPSDVDDGDDGDNNDDGDDDDGDDDAKFVILTSVIDARDRAIESCVATLC